MGKWLLAIPEKNTLAQTGAGGDHNLSWLAAQALLHEGFHVAWLEHRDAVRGRLHIVEQSHVLSPRCDATAAPSTIHGKFVA